MLLVLLLSPPLPSPPPPAGQEEVDDVIRRDMHRTFPEHPMFSAEEGQCALFRVLKAYSLHDLEVKLGAGALGNTPGISATLVPAHRAVSRRCALSQPGHVPPAPTRSPPLTYPLPALSPPSPPSLPSAEYPLPAPRSPLPRSPPLPPLH